MAKEKVEGALTKKSARLAPRGGARDTDGFQDHTRLFDSPVRRRAHYSPPFSPRCVDLNSTHAFAGGAGAGGGRVPFAERGRRPNRDYLKIAF